MRKSHEKISIEKQIWFKREEEERKIKKKQTKKHICYKKYVLQKRKHKQQINIY